MNAQQDDMIVVTQADFHKLLSLARADGSEIAAMLEEELGRAAVVPDDQLPADVVAMNSKVSFLNLETQRESVVTLVYPQDANISENKISILTPVGSALIGLRVGQEIEWPFPDGRKKKLRIVSILAQG